MIEKAGTADKILDLVELPIFTTSKSKTRELVLNILNKKTKDLRALKNALDVSNIHTLKNKFKNFSYQTVCNLEMQYFDKQIRNKIQRKTNFDPGADLANITDNSVNQLSLNNLLYMQRIINSYLDMFNKFDVDTKLRNIRYKTIVPQIFCNTISMCLFWLETLAGNGTLQEEDNFNEMSDHLQMGYWSPVMTGAFEAMLLIILEPILERSNYLKIINKASIFIPPVLCLILRPISSLVTDSFNGISESQSFYNYFKDPTVFQNQVYKILRAENQKIASFIAMLTRTKQIIDKQILTYE